MRKQAKPKISGSVADRLVKRFLEDQFLEFDDLANEVLDAGRAGVVDVAVRKAMAYGEEVAINFIEALADAAEWGSRGDDVYSFVVVPALIAGEIVHDTVKLARSLESSGFFSEAEKVHLLPGWRSLLKVGNMDPCGVRRALNEMIAGSDPVDLPMVPSDAQEDPNFLCLIGICLWAREAHDQPESDIDTDGTAEAPRSLSAFDAWISENQDILKAIAILLPTTPSSVLDDVEDFLEEMPEDEGDLPDELIEFIDSARKEAEPEAIQCRVIDVPEGAKLDVFTVSGRALDSRIWTTEELGISAEELRELLEDVVTATSPSSPSNVEVDGMP